MERENKVLIKYKKSYLNNLIENEVFLINSIL